MNRMGAMRWLLPWLGLLMCAAAWAGPPTVQVQASDEHLVLLPRAEMLEDTGGRTTLADVRGNAGWLPSPRGETRSFGYTRSAWWLRLRLESDARGATQNRILELAASILDYMDLYLVRPSGEVVASYQTGDRRPFSQRGLDYRNPAFTLALEPGKPLDVYLRLDSYDGLLGSLAMNLWSEGGFVAKSNGETVLFGIYYGTLLALLVYNLLLFLSTRDRAFGWYVAYVASFFVWNFTFLGYAQQYWWPDNPHLNALVLALACGVSFINFLLFVMEYVQVRAYSPWRLYPLALLGLAGCVAVCLPVLFGYFALGFLLSVPVWLAVMVGCIGVGVVMAMDRSAPGSRAARFALLAFTPLAIVVGLYCLTLAGLLRETALTASSLQVGSAAEVLLLAFGLADQMNTLKAQKLAAEQAARKAQAALATRLEQQVQERTRELEQANRQLACAAITDELTGAFNRRHFNEIFAAEIRRRRGSEQFGFCILDVDHFKSYNDRYGHQMGDEVLHTISAALRVRLQRSGDKLFRLGGEEFGIVMGVDDVQQAWRFADVLRSEVESLKIPHEDAPLGVVTASFGLLVVAAMDSNAQPKDIYAAADALLYQAKSAGRNRIQCGVA
ncbi:MAG: sensor domain-containing diguanylate cyclase [Nevskia sp.]|nr:sensor domain-containing diguanylate cyclase [Nevskia sp.]